MLSPLTAAEDSDKEPASLADSDPLSRQILNLIVQVLRGEALIANLAQEKKFLLDLKALKLLQLSWLFLF